MIKWTNPSIHKTRIHVWNDLCYLLGRESDKKSLVLWSLSKWVSWVNNDRCCDNIALIPAIMFPITFGMSFSRQPSLKESARHNSNINHLEAKKKKEKKRQKNPEGHRYLDEWMTWLWEASCFSTTWQAMQQR